MNAPALTKTAQRARLLQALRTQNGVTTSEAREALAVMHPAGRVRELRAEGHPIATRMGWVEDGAGVRHRQATYVLTGGVAS